MLDPGLHTFDDRRGWHLFLHDAYQGGLRWEQPSSGALGTAVLYGHRVVTTDQGPAVVEQSTSTESTYLVPWSGEARSNFLRRKALAVYINLPEPIVDAYVDSVTSRVSRTLGTLDPYLGSLDGDGQSWDELITTVARNAALDGVTAVVFDAPAVNAATNRAEEQAAGIGLRATVVSVPSWAWVRLDDRGAVEEFAYLDAQASNQTSLRARVWVWSRTTWALYDCELPVHTVLSDRRDGILAGKPTRTGAVSPRLGGRLPVVFCYHRRNTDVRVPEGKSLAAASATIARQLYQLLSQIEDTHRRAPPFVAIPSKAKGALEPETQAKVGPDHALPIPEGAGPPTWVTFPPESLKDIREHAAFLVALAYRISGLEVQADQSAQVQSGEALRLRSRDFEARAKKLAKDVEAFERRALALCALYLDMRGDDVTLAYPTRYVLGDTSELLTAALLLLEKIGGSLGPEGTAALMRQALVAATALDDAQVAKIMAEIEAKLGQAKAPSVELNSFNTPWAAGNEVRATMGLSPVAGGEVIAALEEQKRAAATPAAAPSAPGA